MKERPILFNGEMVRMILSGKKTQTRRLKGLKGQTEHWRMISFYPKTDGTQYMHLGRGETKMLACPYGKPGDRLWVRETWATPGNWDEIKPSELIEYPGFNTDLLAYRATENFGDAYFKWRPSIHMPRWASRITLEITEVRIERLQEIILDDCKSEGIPQFSFAKGILSDNPPDPRWKFIELWDSINAKRGFGWDKNPWVWVINFSLITKG